MKKYPFDPSELTPSGCIPAPGGKLFPVLQTPITPRENFKLLLDGQQPVWLPTSVDYAITAPRCMPDSWAHGVVFGPGITPDQYGGKDMFGVEWEYDVASHGSTVRPGKPLVPDIEHWEDYVIFPDVDSWDWESTRADAAFAKSHGRIVRVVQQTGLFERLISMADMTPALIALIDEDVKPAVHRLFDYLCGLYDQLFAKYKEYLDADMVWFMDDWGSQRAPLFSEETAREMILPYLKRIRELAHKHGMYFDFHSCGNVTPLVSVMVDAGCDIWDGQELNDKPALLEHYNQKIVLKTRITSLPEHASNLQIEKAVAEYFNIYGGKSVYLDCSDLPPQTVSILYEMSRKAYSE